MVIKCGLKFKTNRRGGIRISGLKLRSTTIYATRKRAHGSFKTDMDSGEVH